MLGIAGVRTLVGRLRRLGSRRADRGSGWPSSTARFPRTRSRSRRYRSPSAP